jgi:microcystin degradation protein MlrC
MRIAIAEIAQETDSFSPMVADLQDFEAFGLYFGEELLEKMQNVGPFGGLFQVAGEQKRDIEWIPLVRAWAGPGVGWCGRHDHRANARFFD